VTTPLYLADPPTLDGAAAGTRFELGGDEGRHAATVRRTRAGERVDVADGAGLVARCTVVEARRDALVLAVDAVERVPARLPRLVLVQALAKGGRDEQAVETATELGVDAVVPWQAARSIAVRVGEKAERGRRRWEATVRAAAKQSRRPSVPAVGPAVTTAQLVTRLGAGPVSALVLHEDAASPLAAVPLPNGGVDGVPEVLVVVGPEGGIGDEELAALVGAGATAVRLGPEVLRTSSAGPAALAVLSVRLGRWS
jgi:16S rRNA (uracil1498-N3)-methyltransferase